MNNSDITDIVLPRYLKGEYNDILQRPTSFDRNGKLSQTAKSVLFKKMTGTTQAINELQHLFPGDDPMKAYSKISSYFGEDPINSLGAGVTKRLFKDLRSTARATGISEDDVVNLMANIGTEYRKSGRDPLHALSSAKDLMVLSAASREGPGNINPGKWNQAMMANIDAARHSPIADVMGQTYSALVDRVGEAKARKTLAAVTAKTENLKDPKQFLTAVNAHIGKGVYPIDQDLLKTYAGKARTKYFTASGMGTMTMLKHYGNEMQGFRKKLLAKKFDWDADQIQYLDRMGGPTIANIHKYIKGRNLPHPDDARKQIFAIEESFNKLAKSQGFEKAEAADRFLKGTTNENALNRFRAAAKRSRRVSASLDKRQRPGGIRGVTQYLSGNKTSGNWWEALTGSQTLKPQQIAELQGIDIDKFDQKANNTWESALEGWLSPETSSNAKRDQSLRDIRKMSGV